jgi:hypothetical protein
MYDLCLLHLLLIHTHTHTHTPTGAIICLLAALPHIMDSGKKGREGYLDTLMEVAKKNRRAPIR